MFYLEQFDGRCGCNGAFHCHYAPHTNKLYIRIFVQHDWRPNCGRCILPIECCFATVDGQCGDGAFVSVGLSFIVMVEEVCNLLDISACGIRLKSTGKRGGGGKIFENIVKSGVLIRLGSTINGNSLK